MRSKESITKNRGFTLIEIIVVITILGIIAAIAIPNIVSYIKISKQEARVQDARAVFSVAQNAMTHYYSKGDGSDIHYDGETKINDVVDKSSYFTSDELKNNANNIRYLVINKNESDKEKTTLYQLINNYLSDQSILDNTVMVEYNYRTGKVLSAFYSDVKDDIGYSNSDAYNALTRDKTTLKNNETGYWGVDSTGIDDTANLTDVNAQIVDYDNTGSGVSQGNNINSGSNYGLLTAEFKLPSTYRESYGYKITLSDDSSKSTDVVINIDAGAINALPNDLNSAISGNGMYIDSGTNGSVLVLVLDTPDSGYSISSKFNQLKGEYLTAHLDVYSDGDNVKQTVSNSACKYFEKKTEDGNYDISSIRHLNNIRYGNSDANYVQTKDIYCRSYDSAKAYYFDPITCSGDTLKTFNGTYEGKTDNAAYKIFDLTINSDNAGLFARTGSSSYIDGITLDYSSGYIDSYNNASDANKSNYYIHGISKYTGGISSINYGTISNCSVDSGIIRSTSAANDSAVGGITGFNAAQPDVTGAAIASINQCYNGADVKGPYASKCNAGGISGINCANINRCENGTCRDSNNKLTGMPFYGARPVNTDYSYPGDCDNDESLVTAFISGGIAGRNTRAYNYTRIAISTDDSADTYLGSIRYCVNAAKIYGHNDACTAGYEGTYYVESYAGGICGLIDGRYLADSLDTNHTVINHCYNAGEVIETGTGNTDNLMAGGIVASASRANAIKKSRQDDVLSNGTIVSSYNTGDVTAQYLDSNSGNTIVRAGGICAWAGFGGANKCYNIGNISASGSSTAKRKVGGRFGDGNNSTYFPIDSCYCVSGVVTLGGTSQSDVDKGSYVGREKLKSMDSLDLAVTKQKIGPFDYVYPYISIQGLSSDFHRTPWKDNGND